MTKQKEVLYERIKTGFRGIVQLMKEHRQFKKALTEAKGKNERLEKVIMEVAEIIHNVPRIIDPPNAEGRVKAAWRILDTAVERIKKDMKTKEEQDEGKNSKTN